jgi:hypothetical protein
MALRNWAAFLSEAWHGYVERMVSRACALGQRGIACLEFANIPVPIMAPEDPIDAAVEVRTSKGRASGQPSFVNPPTAS